MKIFTVILFTFTTSLFAAEALFVMDMQRDFVGKEAKYSIEESSKGPVISNVNTVIQKAQQKGIPVVYIRTEFSPYDIIKNVFRKFAAIRGNEGAKMDERILMVSDLEFIKDESNALTNKDLMSWLQSEGITNLVLVGVFSDKCVYKTAKGAIKVSLGVSVIKEAVATSSHENYVESLQNLEALGATMIDLKDW